jgi:hypothetical protein
MKIKFLAIASAVLLALCLSLVASAGSVTDTDGDLVPDGFDNCTLVANGPNQDSNQVDTDGDGYGNACDCDFIAPAPGNGTVLGDDIVAILGAFNTNEQLYDITGDGIVLGNDIVACFNVFNGSPGPSGLNP